MAGRLAFFSTLLDVIAPQLSPFDYQREFIDDYTTRMVIYRKSRQVGISTAFAAKALGKGIAIPGYRMIFVSLGLDDAKEKILYVRDLYDAIAEVVSVPRITIDNKKEMILDNGSRFIAVHTPRGKAKADIALDEFAYHSAPRKVYRELYPILSFGGQLCVASTVFHAGTMFNMIWEGEGDKFGGFVKRSLYWWDSPIHCRDTKAARLEASDLQTEERVYKFGTRELTDAFENMLEEDFQAEYELKTIDDESAHLPWSLITGCTPTDENEVRQFENLFSLLDSLTETGRRAFAGYDVGRRRDTGEFSCLVEDSETGLFERLLVTFDRESFDTQQTFLDAFCQHPNTRLAIDETGMGMQMAEALVEAHGDDKVLAISFTNPMKAILATTAKRYMLKNRVHFKADKDATLQMHSIKKRVTDYANVTYVVEAGEVEATHGRKRHHGDKAWARFLGIYAHAEELSGGRPDITVI